VFSGALYEKLLVPGLAVDQAVAAARSALVSRFTAGHRSWVNPTVYWRCKDGYVFELLDVAGNLSPQQRLDIARIDAIIEEYETIMRSMATQPAEMQPLTAPLRAEWQAKIQELLTSRGNVIGETLRLRGGRAKADGTIECVLTIRLQMAATIGDVQVALDYDPNDFDVAQNAAGQDVRPQDFFFQAQAGQAPVVLVRSASQNVAWPAREYELAKIVLRLRNPGTKVLFRVPLANPTVSRNGGTVQGFPTLHAVVFG
jgi:hypothetical protein